MGAVSDCAFWDEGTVTLVIIKHLGSKFCAIINSFGGLVFKAHILVHHSTLGLRFPQPLDGRGQPRGLLRRGHGNPTPDD